MLTFGATITLVAGKPQSKVVARSVERTGKQPRNTKTTPALASIPGHESTRDVIINAALEMVQTEGIEAISMREIARRAGLSSGAPFRHFKDRNELLAAVAEDGFRALDQKVMMAMAGVGEDVVDQLKELGYCIVSFAAEHPAHFRVMHDPALDLSKYPNVQTLVEQQHQLLKQLIVMGQQRGLLRKADPDLLVLMCVSLVGGLARMFVEGGSKCPIELNALEIAGSPELRRKMLKEVDQLARDMVELAGIGLVSDEARPRYEAKMPERVRGER